MRITSGIRYRLAVRACVVVSSLLVFACSDSNSDIDDGGTSLGDSYTGDSGSGWYRLPDGRVVFTDASSVDVAVCAEVKADLNVVTPTVVLLVDRSGSMEGTDRGDWGGLTRWEAVYETLMDAEDGAVKRLESKVRLGLAMYTGQNGNPCPIVDKVAPAVNNYDDIDAIYKDAVPDDDTPTGDSIKNIIPDLEAITEPGPKIIVLATDGEPDSCKYPDPRSGSPEAEFSKNLAISATQEAYAAGIKTYVIAVGPNTGNIQDVANAGIGLPPNGDTDAPYYTALEPNDLVTAFDEIVGGAVKSCEFEIEGSLAASVISLAVVKLDGDELTKDTQWRIVDGERVEILGDSCTTYLNGNHTIEAIFPCGVELY